MPKIFNVKYTTNAGTPAKGKAAIVITGTKLKCVAVPAPSEGRLLTLTVKQISGTGVAVVVELLDSVVPFPVGEADVAAVAADTIESYRIIPQQGAAISAAIEFRTDHGYGYHNADAESYTDNIRLVYLVIKPTAASGSSTWAVTLRFDTDIG